MPATPALSHNRIEPGQQRSRYRRASGAAACRPPASRTYRACFCSRPGRAGPIRWRCGSTAGPSHDLAASAGNRPFQRRPGPCGFHRRARRRTTHTPRAACRLLLPQAELVAELRVVGLALAAAEKHLGLKAVARLCGLLSAAWLGSPGRFSRLFFAAATLRSSRNGCDVSQPRTIRGSSAQLFGSGEPVSPRRTRAPSPCTKSPV